MTLLALEISSLSPDPYIPILHQTLATNLDSANLCIVLFLSEELKRNLDSSSKRAGHFSQLQEFVSRLYVASAVKVDVICDLVFGDWCGYLLEEEVWDYSILSLPESAPGLVSKLPRSTKSVRTVTYINDPETTEIHAPSLQASSEGRDHPVVAGPFHLGGTFDHLHPGHKILLTCTAIIASQRLICGITDDALLKNKKYAQVLEPISLRISNVRKFLTLIARHLTLDLVPISDVYGPTAYDPEISALVISEETKAGAEAIESLRKEKGLRGLEVFVIDVIGESPGKLRDMAVEKMSSTKIRERIVKEMEGKD